MSRVMLLVLHVISLVFFGFGIMLDMLKIDITANFFIDINLFNERRSVLGTLQSLWGSGDYFPFSLIFFFGLVVPLVKTAIIFYILLATRIPSLYYKLLTAISKWAMADVFAVSIFISFLGARAMKNTTATLEPGFYWFTAYVLLSAVVVSLLKIPAKNVVSSNG
jgi:paraquat-inducible protein A